MRSLLVSSPQSQCLSSLLTSLTFPSLSSLSFHSPNSLFTHNLLSPVLNLDDIPIATLHIAPNHSFSYLIHLYRSSYCISSLFLSSDYPHYLIFLCFSRLPFCLLQQCYYSFPLRLLCSLLLFMARIFINQLLELTLRVSCLRLIF